MRALLTPGRAAIALAALGLAVMVVGFGIDPLWPAQDETPEMAREAARQAAVAAWVYRAGLTLLAAGALLGAAAALRRAWR